MTDIEKAIMASGLGLNPMNDGELGLNPSPYSHRRAKKRTRKNCQR